MAEKLVSIIIVNWNGGEIFEKCLISLAKIKYSYWELIVVDNGSTDGSQMLPRNFHSPISDFQLIQNKKNHGFAPANNQGFVKAKGDYILLLNNDTKVTPDLLTKLVARMQASPDLAVIQPKIYLMDKPNFLDNAGSFITRIGFMSHWGFGQKDSLEFKSEREIFSAKGACMLIRKEVIDKVGLFDESFFSYFEETDFCWRVWLAGFKILYFPKAHIYHKVGFTIRRQNVLNINYHYYKNRIASQLKNFAIKNIFSVLVVHLCLSLGIATVFLLKLNFSSAGMILRAIFWNLINLSTTLQKRRQVQALRVVSDDLLFKKLSAPVDWKKFFADFRRVEKDIKRKQAN